MVQGNGNSSCFASSNLEHAEHQMNDDTQVTTDAASLGDTKTGTSASRGDDLEPSLTKSSSDDVKTSATIRVVNGGDSPAPVSLSSSEDAARRRSRRSKRAPSTGPFILSTETAVRKKSRSDRATTTKKKEHTDNVDAEKEFDQDWICAECKEAECLMVEGDSELIICEGCRRVFHYPCAGYDSIPEGDFICQDCKTCKHMCSICSNYGIDNEDVFNCNRNDCGLFFHESCLAIRNVEVEIDGDTNHKVDDEELHPPDSPFEMDETVSSINAKRVFVCPAHACWTCVQKEMIEKEEQEAEIAAANAVVKKNKGKSRRKKKKFVPSIFEPKRNTFLHRCIECSTSYHTRCIPPSAKFHELAVLCPDHSQTHKLPFLDPKDSMQDQIERRNESMLLKFEERRNRRAQAARSGGKNVFFSGMSGTKVSKQDSEFLRALERQEESGPMAPVLKANWFCLPCNIKDEVHSKPPSYRHVRSLQYSSINKPPRIPPAANMCECMNVCDEHCTNRVDYTECYGNKSKDGSKTNCRVGLSCGNRQLAKMNAAKCKPQREQGKGWGLCLVDDAEMGDLIQEYVGEVIDEKSKEERLAQWAIEHPNDPNFYIMALQKDWYIDAREVANLSRFINHSCDPNCRLLQINVNGRMRCGIFALRHIKAGEFLSYDYDFDTKHGDRFVCCCGAANCRGTMKGGSNQDGQDIQKKSKTAIWEDAKAAYERDRKFLNDYHSDRQERSSQVDVSVPAGDSDELIANGPQRKNRHGGVFLWRTALIGADFASRIASLESRNR